MVTPLRGIRISDEQWESIHDLAAEVGMTAAQLLRDSVPDPAVLAWFVQNKQLDPSLTWHDVVTVAVRRYLNELYEKNLPAHLGRLGLKPETASVRAIAAARKRILTEMEKDAQCPCHDQLEKAKEDSIYLGRLYEAWTKAKQGEKDYLLVNSTPTLPADKSRRVVYVNGQKL